MGDLLHIILRGTETLPNNDNGSRAHRSTTVDDMHNGEANHHCVDADAVLLRQLGQNTDKRLDVSSVSEDRHAGIARIVEQIYPGQILKHPPLVPLPPSACAKCLPTLFITPRQGLVHRNIRAHRSNCDADGQGKATSFQSSASSIGGDLRDGRVGEIDGTACSQPFENGVMFLGASGRGVDKRHI
jgi:hypothetical protein